MHTIFQVLDKLPKNGVPSIQYLAYQVIARSTLNFYESKRFLHKEIYNKDDALNISTVQDIVSRTRKFFISKLPFPIYTEVANGILQSIDWCGNDSRVVCIYSIGLFHPEQKELHIKVTHIPGILLNELMSYNFESVTYAQVDSCTNEALSVLAERCPAIKTLDFSFPHLKPECVREFKKFSSLQELNFDDRLDVEILENLLLELPSLVSLEDDNIMRVLRTFQDEKYDMRLNLKKARCDVDCMDDIRLITKYCPNLVKLTLFEDERSGYDDDHDLLLLSGLKHLNELCYVIGVPNFFEVNFDKFLQIRGHDLVNLQIQFSFIDVPQVICIGKTCPNLEGLSFGFNTFRHDMFSRESRNDLLLKKAKYSKDSEPMFQKLQVLLVDDCSDYAESHSSDSDVPHSLDSESLVFILSRAINIKSLYVSDELKIISDEQIKQILETNSMAELENLDALANDLSLETFEMLLNSCKSLKRCYLKYETDYGGVKGTEIKRYIEEHNIELNVTRSFMRN